MKKYSKLLSGVMALAMVACMGTTAFAAETPSEGTTGDTTKDVMLNATVPTPTDEYYVNITWGDMTFTYSGGTAASEWDQATHDYNNQATVGSWVNDSATVKVTNNSNVPVTLSGEYTASGYENGQETDGVTVSYTNFTEAQLAAGDSNNVAGGTTSDNQATATVSVSGNPTKSLDNVKAGSITVTIGAVD